ncbi:hypothetical protein [Marinimicrobium sp. ABcell2]|uniref:hypothetical protein n=1 Tax=Marinimicrobium sp. ABcell2 TaxID=3069751 RepID=UPI0027B596E8|nr:hypothetical protein [Marinimicrobium sp. ABcell2]MDQ2075317.1 hypothetical protein [Marinimicrobium sp. ABcell2]
MKKILWLLVPFLCAPAFACDETCKREAAMQEHGVRFSSYLTASYCRDTSVDFLLRARDSLANYKANNLPTGHKGGMRNIRNFLQQRKQWLAECDEYLRLTGQGRVFRDEATTQQILEAIDAVSNELERLMGSGSGVRVPQSQVAGADQRLDLLFTAIDHHRTELQLRGQLVIR